MLWKSRSRNETFRSPLNVMLGVFFFAFLALSYDCYGQIIRFSYCSIVSFFANHGLWTFQPNERWWHHCNISFFFTFTIFQQGYLQTISIFSFRICYSNFFFGLGFLCKYQFIKTFRHRIELGYLTKSFKIRQLTLSGRVTRLTQLFLCCSDSRFQVNCDVHEKKSTM